ncbi:MAG TPA: hypothetical protein DCE55_23495 [Planctomycetaceae bacterium]|nr:hypothetical protein [Planctomycetaceae bacterium]
MNQKSHVINRVGTKAFWEDLVSVDGTEHRLSDYRGHWVVLMFHRHLA